MTQSLIIYHFSCVDGIAAAWAARDALPDADFWSASYGQQPPYDRARGHDVLIVDFSYPLADLRSLAEVARSVLVLDHHDTAREALAEVDPLTVDWPGWLGFVEDPENSGPNLAALFDLKRSGCGITWDYLHPDQPRPLIVELVEDRDLWRFRHDPDTRRFHAALTSYDLTDREAQFSLLDEWNKLRHTSWVTLMAEGAAILRAQDQAVKTIVDTTRRVMRIGGHDVPVVNSPVHQSELGNALLERFPAAPLAGVYWDVDGRRKFSLRSRSGAVHVGQLARKLGGGGHERAAGFEAPAGWEGRG